MMKINKFDLPNLSKRLELGDKIKISGSRDDYKGRVIDLSDSKKVVEAQSNSFPTLLMRLDIELSKQ